MNFLLKYKIFIHENCPENIVCKMAAICSRERLFNSSGAATRIFWENKVHTIAADALAPSIARSSAAMV